MSTCKRLWVLIMYLLLLTSCSSSANPNVVQQGTQLPSPAATITPTATPTEPTLGPVPHNCPVGTPILHTISPNLGPVIGTSPVWADWPSGPSVFHLAPTGPNYIDTYEAPYGWSALKVIWEVEPHYTHPITVRGYELSDHTPLLLQFDGEPTGAAVLDPQHPTHPVSVVGSEWKEWGSQFVVSKAGCYVMEVSWPTGHWSVTIAFGA